MRAVITVIGKDRIGIIAGISNILAGCGVNILDISQTIMQGFFTMMMIADLTGASEEFSEIAERLEIKGKELGVSVTLQHEDIFNSMHRI